jgi:hypothetical protein
MTLIDRHIEKNISRRKSFLTLFADIFSEKANPVTSGCLCRTGVGLHVVDRPRGQPRRHRRLRPEADPLGRSVQQGHGRQDSAQAKAEPGTCDFTLSLFKF